MNIQYDVVIIGGGIHGVGVAQAAAVKGYKTILLEQYDHLAEGTSSRSSKLIHGGLRYLEQFEFSLVHECLVERSYLLKNAPDLVKLTPVYIPIYSHSQRTPWMIRTGLTLYALLGSFKKDAAFKIIPKAEWNNLHNIETNGLRAVYQYYEAQTDDQLLTQAVMNSAIEYGAELNLDAKVVNIKLVDDSCEVTYQAQSGKQSILTSSTVVNAAGPWARQVLQYVAPQQKLIDVDLVQGAHIVLPIQLGEVIFYIESPQDGRPIFIMPWYGKTMIGTTETIYKNDPAEIRATDKEIEYLLHAFYSYFPNYKSQNIELREHFAGLRVLPKNNKDANQRSRETIYLRDRKHKPRLLSIFGGKLTAYRATSEQVIKYLHSSLPPSKSVLKTSEVKLSRPS